jgi:uncharacterized protein
MKLLIDVTHPAHVHFFKCAARLWKERGHQVKFVARDKEMTIQLLDEFEIPYKILSKIRKGLLGLSLELIEHQARLLKIIKKYRPDMILNIGGTFIVHIGKLSRVKTCVFTDTEHAKLSNGITFPFASFICTPESFFDNLGEKHYRYKGYQELTYLHPNQFSPNPNILSHLNLKEDERFFLLRFVSWGASHDIGKKGMSLNGKRELVERLNKYGKVLISSEEDLPKDLTSYLIQVNPIYIHDLLYYSSIYIGEGATMASEAAILGTPSVYTSPLELGYLSELDHRYQLMYHFRDGDADIDKLISLAKDSKLKEKHHERLQRMLDDKVDVTTWIVEFVESLL